MKTLITGGAGFIGCNIAERLIKQNQDVIIFDNLSRIGAAANLRWLKTLGAVEFVRGDIRQYEQLRDLFRKHPDIDVVYHMAGQVAVTTSVSNPREDFENNALGTFNLLEAIRLGELDPVLIFASTNKVYGGMKESRIIEQNGQYTFQDFPSGISEDQQLDFHSPYGCSKGTADQYVNDYARIYGLKTITFRQSCIYGYRQFGKEDQGWVAWFTIQAIFNRPVTIYGNGKQVRDILFIDDLLNAYESARKNIEKTKGKVYNIGGGSQNTMCLLKLIAYLEKLTGKEIKVLYDDCRSGDQLVFICNINRAKEDFGWEPVVSPEGGIKKLFNWISENKQLFIEEGM